MKIGNLEVYGIIYKITNKINNKVYIGQTSRKYGFKDRYSYSGKGIERVYKYHQSNKSNKLLYNSHLLRSIEKYDFEAFQVNEIFDIAFSKDELNIKEELWIKIYKSNNGNYGYNHSTGGESAIPNKEVREKMRNKALIRFKDKRNHPRYGISRYGEENPFYGKEHTDETKNKISNNRKGKGLKDVNWMTLTGGYKGKDNPKSTKVICITTGKIFECLADGAEYYGMKRNSHIGDCCLGKRKYCGTLEDRTKLQWMYYDEYIELQQAN